MASPETAVLPSLLLLPSPPRPATRAALRAAYHLPLSAVLARLSEEHKQACSSDSGSSPPAPVLVVAVAAPTLAGPTAVPSRRTIRWSSTQALVARLYTLIASICADGGIDTDAGGRDPGAVDARIVLVDHEPGRKPSWYLEQAQLQGRDRRYTYTCTSVPDLAAFAATAGPWKTVFHPSGEPGYELVNSYLDLATGCGRIILQKQIIAVKGGLSFCVPATQAGIKARAGSKPQPLGAAAADTDAVQGYTSLCLGGTFDHLHPGHKLLLHASTLLLRVPLIEDNINDTPPCTLIIGVSSDELLKRKKYAEELQSWDERSRSVLQFLATVLGEPSTAELRVTDVVPAAAGDADRTAAQTAEVDVPTRELHGRFRNGAILVRCFDLRDPYGRPIWEEDVEAIVVSAETRGGAAAINEKRAQRQWRPLDSYEIDVLGARDDDDDNDGDDGRQYGDAEGQASGKRRSEAERIAAKISSTEIRRQKAEARARRRQQQ
ncbi:cytidylyltransferase [Purpureocillium lavendulum]|uniref:Cytidylyltransferase n=1 Tax=Purpureocillium lavendulum TaxID=1247861 RepID=A0AB34FKC3_9HYPO|nr:cytidylyltransferase [Purpureocillium lavendulum]